MSEIDCPTEVLTVVPSPRPAAARVGLREVAEALVGQVEHRLRGDDRGHAEPSGREQDQSLGWVQWCLDHQLLLSGLIAGAILALGLMLSLADGSSSSSGVQQPAQTAYQQGYSYGQRLDNQGYGSDEAYSACRGSKSQQQYPQDIGVFQMACDIGYAQ